MSEEPIDFEDFVILVAQMRSAQKSFFKTRSTEDLQRAKSFEAHVDDAVQHLRLFHASEHPAGSSQLFVRFSGETDKGCHVTFGLDGERHASLRVLRMIAMSAASLQIAFALLLGKHNSADDLVEHLEQLIKEKEAANG